MNVTPSPARAIRVQRVDMPRSTARDPSRSSLRVAGILLSLSMAGCAAVDHPPRGDAAPETGPALAEAPAATAAPETSAAPPGAATPQPAPDALVAGPAEAPPKKPSNAPSKPPASRPATKATVGSGTAAAAAIPAPATPSAPPLDLKALVARLRETKAIGMFTKLALKNQVDDLLDRFREHYATQVKASVAELRPPYDRLLLKVLAAVQDEDPDLARAIVDSREPIWEILADPARFATI